MTPHEKEEVGRGGRVGSILQTDGKGVAMEVQDILALFGLSADIFWWLRK